MQRFGLIYTQNWYISLPVWQKELVRTSLELYSREERLQSNFGDYSFVIFPMAKAFEGFLKTYFYSLGVISREVYLNKHFRVGRALNPDVRPEHRDNQWVYDRLGELCGREFTRQMWDTWLECRNQVFHYFPDNQRRLTLHDAALKIEQMAVVMEKALECTQNQEKTAV